MATTLPVRASSAREVARVDESTLNIKLAALRKERTLSEAAAMVGIRADELSRIESGKTKQIRWETMLRILLAYDCEIEDLIEIKVVAPIQEPTPREVYLTAMRNRKRNIPRKRLLPYEVGTSSDEVSVLALSEKVDRGVVRRKYISAVERNK